MNNWQPRVDASEVKRLLQERVEEFCMEHLSAGKRVHNMWKVGSAKNDEGDSFVVWLDGPRRGQFYENSRRDGDPNIRTLIDIYSVRYGKDFREALAECERWLRDRGAIHDMAFTRETARNVRNNTPPAAAPEVGPRDGWKPVSADSEVGLYLTRVRGISLDVLERYKVGEGKFWFAEFQKAVPGYVFPYYVDGKLVTAKYIALERLKEADGKEKKVSRVLKGTTAAYYHLWGRDLCDPAKGNLVVAEGEIDAMSYACAGIQAVSVPMGAKEDRPDAPNHGNDWIENDFDWLKLWSSVTVAMDNDDAGRAASRSIVPRLGKERCRVMRWPQGVKDANEVLMAEAEERLPLGTLEQCVQDADEWCPELFMRAGQFRDDIWNEFFPAANGAEEGLRMPWEMPFRIRNGELSVWSGYSKHGKTVCQTFCMTHLAFLGQKVCIASLEMPPRKTLKNVMRMGIGRIKPTKLVGGQAVPDVELFDRALSWMDRHFFVYGKTGQASARDVMEVFKFAATRHGVSQFVLDSLMMLDVAEDDLEGIKKLMKALKDFALEFNVHVHLVAHAKKSDSIKRPEDKYPPRKHDIFGSVSITNLCDNVITVWRNITKDEQLVNARARRASDEDIAKIENSPDARILIQAQRGGDGELPVKNLWFDVGGSWQYFDNPGALSGRGNGPQCYVYSTL